MEIIGKIEVKGFLKCNDLDNGDVFTFLDNNEPLMFTRGNCYDFIINLKTGELIEDDDIVYSDKPVRKLKAKLVIED